MIDFLNYEEIPLFKKNVRMNMFHRDALLFWIPNFRKSQEQLQAAACTARKFFHVCPGQPCVSISLY